MHQPYRIACAILLAAATAGIHAQQFPARPMRMLVGYSPGGPLDVAGRLIAQRMFEGTGYNMIVENRDGANGIIAADIVAKSAPDGYSIYLGTTGNLAVNPSLYKKLPYDNDRDFAPLSHIVSVSSLMYVNPTLPARTLQEFIAYAQANPGKLNYSSSGTGGLPHLSGELLNVLAKIKTVHVPYKGTAPAFNALISNEAQFAFSAVVSGLQHVKAGRLRALATTSPKRLSMLPDVPTTGEAYPGFEIDNWYGLVVRAGTPKPIINRLHQEVVRVLNLPDIREKLAAQAWEPVGTTPESFAKFMKAENVKWARVIREAGIKQE